MMIKMTMSTVIKMMTMTIMFDGGKDDDDDDHDDDKDDDNDDYD